MTVQEELKAALRDLMGPAARAHGFRGTAPTWRKSNERGDWAIVNVQTSAFSSGTSLRCVLNLAVAPEPWLDWMRVRDGSGLPKQPNESHGLYRSRLHPAASLEGVDEWWEVGPVSAEQVVVDMVARLDVSGWSTVERLLDRDEMQTRSRAGQLSFRYATELLLASNGPSGELDERLTRMLDTSDGDGSDLVERFVRWARGRARAGRAD